MSSDSDSPAGVSESPHPDGGTGQERVDVAEACVFPRLPTEISSWEYLSLAQEEKVARALSRLAHRFGSVEMPASGMRLDVPHARRAIAYYKEQAFESRPEAFFEPAQDLPKVCVAVPTRLSGGEVLDLSFYSHYRPSYVPFRSEFRALEENCTVHARMWRLPKEENLGTIIAIHGWRMGDHRLSALTLIPGFFLKLGLNVLVYELPYHGRRAPVTQEELTLFPSANIALTNEAFGQAIFDLRSLVSWLELEDQKPVGVVGMSLGGYTAALWASLDRLSFVACVAPLVSMAEVAWSAVHTQKLDEQELGFSEQDLRDAYALHCPLSYYPRTPHTGRMIIAGLKDGIVPPAQPQLLWEHWRRPRIHWLSGGHFGQIVGPGTLHSMHDFLFQLGLAHREPLDIRGELTR